jgi:hypothetical protein
VPAPPASERGAAALRLAQALVRREASNAEAVAPLASCAAPREGVLGVLPGRPPG